MSTHQEKQQCKVCESDDERLGFWHWFFFLGILGIVILSWLYSPVIVETFFNVEKGNAQALFGDSFGALNTLFSGLAFLGVIYAIILQQKELSLTRKELAGSRLALQEQNETQKIQRFETTFFNLISLHNETLDTIERRYSSHIETGKKVISGHVSSIISAVKKSLSNQKEPDIISIFKKVYDQFYKNNSADFGHYFRGLQEIFYIIEVTALPSENEKRYLSILRSHLSNGEMFLLYLHNLEESETNKNYREYLVKHDFFKGMTVPFLENEEHVEEFLGAYSKN